jgi:hypothetical protein
MLHGITGDETSCSSQSSFTVNSYSTIYRFDNLKKSFNNFRGRCSSIREIKIMMFDTVLNKLFLVISGHIEPDDSFHAEFLKDRDVLFGTEKLVLN